ncbi:unnamed protein product [Didymodactylos carnosus]|uniref:Thioredoxin domain-containing protein n=1 Tax=Didymodactylos carnosus TaxID=1234261 RepID=A0A8S2Q4M9_9BILA|nr:unnamed protein product [Didymodactylos carnosus]CAF4084209.1 unnamed protein product [Didymodactylos carnosus]
MFCKTMFVDLFIPFCILLLFSFVQTEPLSLTDKTWKDMLCGQWMVEFYAPWCPACEHFSTTWDQFSKVMIPNDVKVAKININEYPALSGRFRVALLPTIYYVRDGIFRQYNGERSLNAMRAYVENQEWHRTEPNAYYTLQNDYFWPSWLIYITFALLVIFLGLCIGFGVLVLIDYCSSSEPADYSSIPDDSKEELDDSEIQQQTVNDRLLTKRNQNISSLTDDSRGIKTQQYNRVQSNSEIEPDIEDEDQDEEEEEEGEEQEEEMREDDEETTMRNMPSSFQTKSDIRNRRTERKN